MAEMGQHRIHKGNRDTKTSMGERDWCEAALPVEDKCHSRVDKRVGSSGLIERLRAAWARGVPWPPLPWRGGRAEPMRCMVGPTAATLPAWRRVTTCLSRSEDNTPRIPLEDSQVGRRDSWKSREGNSRDEVGRIEVGANADAAASAERRRTFLYMMLAVAILQRSFPT